MGNETPVAANLRGVAGRPRLTVFWVGSGLRPGVAYGGTDEVGWKAVEDPVSRPDFHAPVLHVLGIDHQQLTFYHNGVNRRLKNVHGKVIKKIIAYQNMAKVCGCVTSMSLTLEAPGSMVVCYKDANLKRKRIGSPLEESGRAKTSRPPEKADVP